MKCILASMGFINKNIEFNKNVIIHTMIQYSHNTDIVIFGEAFLQGFYGANFDVEHDTKLAIERDHTIINEIREIARQYNIAVSFGFIEKVGNCFYSSQITIDSNGTVIDIFRRVSPGWKEPFANEQYKEGTGFHIFRFMGKKVVIGLCGDLWYDENVNEVKRLDPDVVFWPVYTDFSSDVWNTSEKYEYASQASKFCDKVLYVNSVCMDKEGIEIARGGSAFFESGTIRQETPSGKESVLLVEIK